MSKNYVVGDIGDIWCHYCQNPHPMDKCPLAGICKFCKVRPATLHFGDMLSFTHGGGKNCCEICSTRQQLEHAVERAKAISKLESRLAKLIAEEQLDRHFPSSA